jgi:hypothetical protein
MTSAWNEPPGRDDRAGGEGAGPEDNQLDMLEVLPRSGSGGPSAADAKPEDIQLDVLEVLPRSGSGGPSAADAKPEDIQLDMSEVRARSGSGPSAADARSEDDQLDVLEVRPSSGSGSPSAARDNGGTLVEPTVEIVSPFSASRDFLDVGGPDSDELRRLEESIRWLMDAGSVRVLPPVATPPVAGAPLRRDLHDDSLLLDPETLFPPRAPQRQGDILRGAAKILLVSAITAPTAYFAASWAQFPGPLDPPAVSAPAPGGSMQVAALDKVPITPATEPTARSIDIAAIPQPEHVAAPAVEKALAPVVGSGPAELKIAPPEQPASTPTVPAQSARSDVETASPVIPVAAPPKPTLRAEDVTLMIERGRTLFDAGDIVAARLFFRRAANAGDSGAAIAMGATYDPEILSQRFIRGIEADAQEAQRWYDKARALGGGGGGNSRIEMLAHR